MRGGERLVKECSWVNGSCFGFCHPTYYCRDFKLSLPLIRLFCQSVPKCRLPKNPASPRGKPRTQKLSVFSAYVTWRVREPTYRHKLRAALSGGIAARVARLATPTGSEVFSVSGCQCIPIDFTKDGKHGKITCFGSFLNIFLWETGKIKKWL